MASIDYYGLEETIRDKLVEADTLAGTAVYVEENGAPAVLEGPAVIVYLLDRTAPPDMQPIAAGRRTRMLVRFSLWCYAVDFEDRGAACRKRDELMGAVELVLMQNRNLGEKAATSYLEGGSFESGPRAGGTGFVASGEITLVADCSAVV